MKLLLSLFLVLLAGCDSQSDRTETRFPGNLLRNDPNIETITAPDTVVVGRSFAITVFTSGGGCFRKGDEEVAVSGLAAEIRPFDVFVDPGPDGACTADLVYYPHTAAVTFAEPGRATLRAIGSGGEGGFGPPPVGAPLVTVERAIVVVAR